MGKQKDRMRALVTGGGGFVGRAVTERLISRGATVTTFSRGDYPELAKYGVNHIRGDLADSQSVIEACRGCDIVFHIAARAGLWGPYEQFYRDNVTATKNVIASCRKAGVRKLVFCSSPSVVFNGCDMDGVDESMPYPTKYKAAYPETKAIAERWVLGANSPELATVALRPHLVWGPRDPHLVPRFIARARAGRLKRVGTQPKKVDFTYIDNAAEAHVLAGDLLEPGSPISGRAYFISDGCPLPLWDFVNRVLSLVDLPPLSGKVPARLAYAAGGICEFLYRVIPSAGEPLMTRMLAEELVTAHWFNIDAARRDLGYKPVVTMDEGFERLKGWLSQSDGERSQPIGGSVV